MRALVAAVALTAVLAPPASAGAQSGPPVVAPGDPGPETLSLGGDSAHRNAWKRTGLRPPLEAAWAATASPVSAPVAAGGRVFVQTDDALVALAADSGDELWKVPLSVKPVELATDGGRVFVTASSGVAALDSATGALIWAAPGAYAFGPVVSGGRLLVGDADNAVTAYQASTGEVLWSTPVDIFAARPAVSGGRAYVTGACRGVALDASSGDNLWTTGCDSDFGTRTLLVANFVLSEDAAIYAASDGTQLLPGPAPGTVGGGDLFRSPFFGPRDELVATVGAGSTPRWSWTPPLGAKLLLRPAVTDDTTVWPLVDAGDEGLLLAGLDAATGAERWTGFIPQVPGGETSLKPTVTTALSVSGGLLLVPTAGGGLVALRNAPEGPLGVSATLPVNVVTARDRTTVTGRLVSNGHGLVGPRPVTLEADRYPFGGGYSKVATETAGRDGFRFTSKVPRNTRYRLRAEGVKYPPTTVYAQPVLSISYKKTKRRRVVRGKLRIRAERGLRRRGRVGLYVLKRGGDVARRIGKGRSSSSGRARFKVKIPKSLEKTDSVLPCLRKASKRGFGAPNVVDLNCGARRIRVPTASQSSAARRSLSVGTGSAIPLKRLLPASEKR